MADPNIEQAIDDAMAELGQSAWYGWRPNQVWTRDPEDPDHYISTDVMTDGSINEILQAAESESIRQIAAIRIAGEEKYASIEAYNAAFERVVAIATQAFNSLRGLFRQYKMPVATAIIEGALNQIHDIHINEVNANE